MLNEKEILQLCVEQAIKSKCLRSRCGSVILSSASGIILGSGFNSPPLNHSMDVCTKDSLPDTFKSDRTCCIHAEQRAIMNALLHSYSLSGSYLYFVRLDDKSKPLASTSPYCTICSKLALDVNISHFCLWNGDSFDKYETKHYNQISFAHAGDKIYSTIIEK